MRTAANQFLANTYSTIFTIDTSQRWRLQSINISAEVYNSHGLESNGEYLDDLGIEDHM